MLKEEKKLLFLLSFLIVGIIVLSGCSQQNGEADKCSIDKDCEDNDDSTKDECKGTPMKCSNSLITECINEDGFCPSNCNNRNDSDCSLPTCAEQGGRICADNERCIGEVLSSRENVVCCSECELMTCEKQSGDICSDNEKCPVQSITALDSSRCCPVKCIQGSPQEDPCALVRCSSNSTCVDGACVLKTCEELGGDLCASSESCGANFIESSDSTQCCPQNCISTPCAGVTCQSNQKCVGGACVLKTCGEQGGDVCLTTETCSALFISALDSSLCCSTTCTTVDLCAGVTCASNQKCVNGTCITKTCAELGGTSCPLATNTCDGLNYYYPNESLECCVGTCTPKPTCDSLSGSFCFETLCEGVSQNTFDTPGNKICCTGTCHTGFCGVATAQATGQQYLDALVNDNYNQFVSVTNIDCITSPSTCQSVFESDKTKAQAYSSIEFNRVSESNGFSHTFFDVILNGQNASITLENQENYVLGGCRVVARIWYT